MRVLRKQLFQVGINTVIVTFSSVWFLLLAVMVMIATSLDVPALSLWVATGALMVGVSASLFISSLLVKDKTVISYSFLIGLTGSLCLLEHFFFPQILSYSQMDLLWQIIGVLLLITAVIGGILVLED